MRTNSFNSNPVWRTVLLVAVLFTASPAAANKGYKIFKEVNKRFQGYKHYTADTKMILKDGKGESFTRELTIKVLEGKSHDKTMIIFSSPADLKNTALLTYWDRSQNVQYLYLPSLKRTKRILGSNQSSPFVGSEFSYEDLVPVTLSQFQYKFMKTTKYKGKPHFVVELRPKFSDSGYKRKVAYVEKKRYLVSKMKLYNRANQHIKTLTIDKFKQYKGRFWLPKKSKATTT